MGKHDPTRQGDAHPGIAEAEAEIVEQHRVIAGWLSGRWARTPEEFAGFADSLVDGFTMIGPDGVLTGLADLLPGFESAYGSVPDLTIDIRDVRPVVTPPRDRPESSVATGGVTVMTYQEWQGSTGRFSTVVLIADPAARLGYRWRHLHETWIGRSPVVDIPTGR
ncbi:MAG: hypothetical protein ACRDRW_02625 [Pseudonocardiaceae bacterium]